MNFDKAPCGKCVYFDKVCPISQSCEKYRRYIKLKRMRYEWLKEIRGEKKCT